VDFPEMPEYQLGIRWADENLDRLRERYTSVDLITSELRSYLFEEAIRRFPSQRESMENDIRQTLFVMGAMRRLTETVEMSRQGAIAIFDASMDLGALIGAELGKKEALDILKARPVGWWRRKLGDATPNDVVDVLSAAWWRDIGHPQKRSRTSKWEVLIYATGTREMWTLARLEKIELSKDSPYVLYRVDGEEDLGFQVIARTAYEGSRIVQHAGEIVG